jgi:hypothetical protein
VTPAPGAEPATGRAEPATATEAGGSSAAGVAGVAGPPSAPERTAAGERPAAVLRQVFPEVTRLVAAGNGSHRLTLRLDPGSLGEVRVQMTVRGGVVRVSLSAAHEAHDALTGGSPELRRLLELTGATDVRVTVRHSDDPAVPTGPGTGPGAGSPAAGGSHSGSPSGHPAGHPDSHARTRGSTTATDGNRDAPSPARPDEPVRSTRPAGLDLTM